MHNLYNKPDSILTHGGHVNGTHETIKQRSDHHESTEDALYAGMPDEADKQAAFMKSYLGQKKVGTKPEVDPDYPRHVHSATDKGVWLNVDDKKQHEAALASGAWQDVPLGAEAKEVVVVEPEKES